MKEKLLSKLTGNKRNVLKLSSGTIVGQALSVIMLPFITRIYGAELIGVLALLISFSTIIKSLSDLGLTNSIMVENEENIECTYKVISTVNLILSLVSALFICLYSFYMLDNHMNSLFLFFFITITFFTNQQIQVSYTWLNRTKHYNVLMYNPILNQGIFGIVSIILGLIGFKTYGYFIGYMLGQIITLIHMRRNLPNGMFTLNINDYRNTIKNNKRFVVYQLPTNVLANFKNQLPTILIQTFWGSQILGYYSITVRVLQMPSSLLANAIGRVFFQTVSNMKREGKEISQYVLRNLINGMKIAIIPIILLIAYGDIGATMFLGKGWETAGEFISILSLMYFFMFLMNTVQGLAITLEKQNLTLISGLFQIIGYVLGAVIGKYYFDSVHLGLFLMSLFYIVIQIIYFSILFKVMGASVKEYIKSLIISLLVILGVSLILREISNFFGL